MDARPIDTFFTVHDEVRHEISKVSKSRFIATIGPYRDEVTLADTLVRLRDEFTEAHHHCYGWRSGARFRYSDDGEPSGTAGRPILQRIDGRGLDHTFVIVTRIFGGTKLGVGGLLRAYGAAAAAVIEVARVIEVVPTRRIHITVPYELNGVVQATLVARHLVAVDAMFAEAVSQTVAVPVGELDRLVSDLLERTAGRARIEILE